MKKYSVFTSEEFDKEIIKFSEEDNKRIENILKQLTSNPYVTDQIA